MLFVLIKRQLADGWVDGKINGWTEMDGWVDGCMDVCIDGWIDGWVDGKADDIREIYFRFIMDRYTNGVKPRILTHN